MNEEQLQLWEALALGYAMANSQNAAAVFQALPIKDWFGPLRVHAQLISSSRKDDLITLLDLPRDNKKLLTILLEQIREKHLIICKERVASALEMAAVSLRRKLEEDKWETSGEIRTVIDDKIRELTDIRKKLEELSHDDQKAQAQVAVHSNQKAEAAGKPDHAVSGNGTLAHPGRTG
jgi:hypothetical protein